MLIIALLSFGMELAVSGPASAAVRAADPAVERGHQLAMRRCAECHAVGRGRESPDGDAPRFSTLRLRFNELSLERRLAGIPWGEHAGMPPVGLTNEDRQDLAAYIESLRSPRG
ncbi:MAG TPA: cytochrome c [Phenylobacterium sp.]|nr:cytochrome c [Phenylobacterium sp.]